MNEWFMRGVQLPLLARCLLALGIMFTLYSAAWLVILYPQQQRQQALNQRIVQLEQQLTQRTHQRSLNPDVAELTRQLAEYESQPRRLSRPLEAVLLPRGEQLEQWAPDTHPGGLTLRLAWRQFQSLFGELAQTTSSMPVRFLVEAQAGRLLAQLWLESDDAS